jgi:hypothetical protein
MVVMFVDCCVGGGWYFPYYSYRRNPTGREFFVSEGITSVLSALGFLNPGLHLMQTLFIFLNLEQSSQLLRLLLITCNFSFTSLWGIHSSQHTLKYKAAAVTLGG